MRMRIVFCEDEPTIRKLIELALRATPHEHRMAADGNEAIELVRRWRPDVLITDFAMPGMDGFQLAAAVRADPELRSLRIVFMSASMPRDLEERTERFQPVSYLRKPFGPAALRDLLGALAEAC
jgi:CheY-like chemotaxis protein